LNAEEYYFIPEDAPSGSEEADVVRRQLITEQLEIFRSKPFVAGAVFWTYRDYRTRSNFVMGLVDFNRNRRGSWALLRQEYAPAVIDSLSLSLGKDNSRLATVALHTRGPIDVDMPVYTLRSYSLQWRLTSPDGSVRFSEGQIPMPTLSPASEWLAEIEFTAPAEEYIITVSIVRPTGYSVIQRSYTSDGKLIS
jgi:beta-glucuronidase